MKNSQHLKAYVQMHPDNKMAWYLLGKEYYKNGQQGKANYCFNQAGEVYEAFEHSKVPAEMLREYEQGLLQSERQRDRHKRRVRHALVLLALLMLVMMPPAVSPGSGGSDAAGEFPLETDDVPAAVEVKANLVTGDAGSSAAGTETLFTAQESKDAASSGKVLANMLQNKAAASVTAVLGMERSGKWLLWTERLPLKSTVEKTMDGRFTYQSYDPVACECQPPEQGELKNQAEAWQSDQEELAVLWSALKSFLSHKGRLPDSLGELSGPFPGNWLGGTTPVMQREFAALKAAAAQATTSAEPAPSAETSSEGTIKTAMTAAGEDAKGKPFFTAPLTIIVDKQKYRLAVTSGSVILRNYEVGLGGDKTPVGSFEITDKVVNPNGRDNGEFGSRGLQLSDSNYAIHGTDEPGSIGKDESLGCIRMKREDVEELFALVPMGTKVQISKGVLPAELLLPKERFPSAAPGDQTNPRKVYHWLN